MAKVGKAIKNAGAMCIYNIKQFPAHKTLKLTTKIRSMLLMLSKLPLPSACVSPATVQLPLSASFLKINYFLFKKEQGIRNTTYNHQN